jgi:3',5'-cyclic-AMP phosphodiesterase
MLRIIQITDTHLLADKHGLLRGHDTDRSLRSVLDHVAQHAAPFDLVLVTGDLAHQAEPNAYMRLKSYLEKTGVPIECLPGNHDRQSVMQARFIPYGIGCANILDRRPWRIIMLNSVIPGQDLGQLSAAELARLDNALRDLTESHALVCLHHPPVPVGNPSMDEMGLSNAAEFFRVIDAHSCVRAILWGHAHSEFADVRRGVQLLGTPSTCFQFRASAAGIAVDDAPPAYRWLWLFPDGTLKTGVTPVSITAID